MRLLYLNGPNLNLLGKREPNVYGTNTLDEINETISLLAKKHQVRVDFFQSNLEGDLINALHAAELDQNFDCIIFNPGAFSHYSYALRDAVASISIPVIEVHLSNIYQREDFRHKSLIAAVARGQITGFGEVSYIAAFHTALYLLQSNNKKDRDGK